MSFIPHNSGLRAQHVARNVADIDNDQPTPAIRILLGDNDMDVSKKAERVSYVRTKLFLPPSSLAGTILDDEIEVDKLNELAPKLPLPENSFEFLDVDNATDNLAASPWTTENTLIEREHPEYDGLPMLVQTDATVFNGHLKGRHDPEKDKPWAPFPDGASALTMAHVRHKTEYMKRKASESFQLNGENRYEPALLEPSWKHAQMAGRLDEEYIGHVREWQKRRAVWKTIETSRSDQPDDVLINQESISVSSATASVPSDCSSPPSTLESVSTAPSTGTTDDSGFSLEPLRRIVRQNKECYFRRSHGDFKPGWAKRGGLPDRETRSAQVRLFGLIKRFWEHIEGREMELKAPPLAPLWAQAETRKVAGDEEWRGGMQDSLLRFYNSLEPDEGDDEVPKTEWEGFISKFKTHPDDDYDQLAQQDEEYDFLALEPDELYDIFDSPDAPIGVFDEAEVTFCMDQERRKLIRELRAAGASPDQIAEFHERTYGVTSQELDEIGQIARGALVESGKLLPKPPPRKRKRLLEEDPEPAAKKKKLVVTLRCSSLRQLS